MLFDLEPQLIYIRAIPKVELRIFHRQSPNAALKKLNNEPQEHSRHTTRVMNDSSEVADIPAEKAVNLARERWQMALKRVKIDLKMENLSLENDSQETAETKADLSEHTERPLSKQNSSNSVSEQGKNKTKVRYKKRSESRAMKMWLSAANQKLQEYEDMTNTGPSVVKKTSKHQLNEVLKMKEKQSLSLEQMRRPYTGGSMEPSKEKYCRDSEISAIAAVRFHNIEKKRQLEYEIEYYKNKAEKEKAARERRLLKEKARKEKKKKQKLAKQKSQAARKRSDDDNDDNDNYGDDNRSNSDCHDGSDSIGEGRGGYDGSHGDGSCVDKKDDEGDSSNDHEGKDQGDKHQDNSERQMQAKGPASDSPWKAVKWHLLSSKKKEARSLSPELVKRALYVNKRRAASQSPPPPVSRGKDLWSKSKAKLLKGQNKNLKMWHDVTERLHKAHNNAKSKNAVQVDKHDMFHSAEEWKTIAMEDSKEQWSTHEESSSFYEDGLGSAVSQALKALAQLKLKETATISEKNTKPEEEPLAKVKTFTDTKEKFKGPWERLKSKLLNGELASV
eukprot:Nk52_evm64s230 gene=Nk52_evmTU64s230